MRNICISTLGDEICVVKNNLRGLYAWESVPWITNTTHIAFANDDICEDARQMLQKLWKNHVKMNNVASFAERC